MVVQGDCYKFSASQGSVRRPYQTNSVYVCVPVHVCIVLLGHLKIYLCEAGFQESALSSTMGPGLSSLSGLCSKCLHLLQHPPDLPWVF